jgi:hypothetical protein
MCSRDVNTTFPIATHALLANRFADHRKGLLTYFAVRHDIVGIVLIQFVNFFSEHELIDFDGALALNGNRFEFFWFELEILSLTDFVSFDDVGGFNLISGLRIDLAILDAVPGILLS